MATAVTLVNRAIFSSPFASSGGQVARPPRPPSAPPGRFFATRSGQITQPGQKIKGTAASGRARARRKMMDLAVTPSAAAVGANPGAMLPFSRGGAKSS